ncbi:MAG: response regulator transcription factor [Acidimicrobiales bacterium]
MAGAVRVLLVEDHEMVLEGLAGLLAEDPTVEVVGTATTVERARELLIELEPDVVVADYQLPDGTGADLVADAEANNLASYVLIISGLPNEDLLSHVVGSGCAGLISKGASGQDLIDAITVVSRGAAVYPATLLQHLNRAQHEARGFEITERELQILEYLAGGSSVDDIAVDASISVHTVRNHIRALLTKLSARSQLEAVVIGVQNGLIEIPPG